MKTTFEVPAQQFEVFAAAYVAEFLASEAEEAKQNLASNFLQKGYTEAEITSEMKVTFDGYRIDVQIIVATPHTDSRLFVRSNKNVNLTLSSYPKNLNVLGAKVEAYLKAKKQREDAEKAAAAAVETERINAEKAAKAQAKKDGEAAILAWAIANGSELLRSRIELGFDFECLAKTEYVQGTYGSDLMKWEKFDNDFDHEKNTRPSLSTMNFIREFVTPGMELLAVRRANGKDFIDLNIQLPSGDWANYVKQVA